MKLVCFQSREERARSLDLGFNALERRRAKPPVRARTRAFLGRRGWAVDLRSATGFDDESAWGDQAGQFGIAKLAQQAPDVPVDRALSIVPDGTRSIR